MPADRDSKTSSEPQRTLPSLLAKCGFARPTLFVGDRQGSPEDPNRPVMTLADSPKKRKRTLSQRPHKKMSSQREKPKMDGTVMSDEAPRIIGEVFDELLGDTGAVNKYTEEHEELYGRETKHAWDSKARSGSTTIERKAEIIIRAIREYERNVMFGNKPSEAIPGPETRDMGGQFLTNKDRINNESKLYEIAKMVPKGALLHLHFNAELYPERLLLKARKMDNMYIRSIRPLLDQNDLDLTEMVFNVLDPTMVASDIDIFSPEYPGDATNWKQGPLMWKVWMPWNRFRDEFEKKDFSKRYIQQGNKPAVHNCGETGHIDLEPAENWLKSKMVLSPEEAYGPEQTVNGVWARFNQATRCFKGLFNYESVYRQYIGQAIDHMIEEKVMYAELRPMLLDKFIPADSGLDKYKINRASQMQLVIDGLDEKKAELEKNGQLDKFPFGLKIIYCTPRSIPNKMMQDEMKTCIELKLQYPDLICGFDLVGAEDRKNHIGHYRNELLAFRATCKKLDIIIPFMFHAGETLLDTGGSSDPKNSNLYDAVLLGSKRIGHGFALMKHPHLIEEFKKKNICIELCPISNELLHLCRNIKEHPYPELLAAGIPCTVNSDNPSLFSNSMSHEFYQIMVGAPTMSLYSWKQLARWSIDYSCLTEKEIARGHDILNRDWAEFCDQVVERYGGLLTGDVIDEDNMSKEEYARRAPCISKT